MTAEWRPRATAAAAGERPAISRHSRHSRHRSRQVVATQWYALVTRNARPLAARVTHCAVASPTRHSVPFARCFVIDPISRWCGSARLGAGSEAEVSVASVRPGREGQAFPSWRWLMVTSETSRSGEPAGSGDPRRTRAAAGSGDPRRTRSERELPGAGESRDSAPQRRQRRSSIQVAITKYFGPRRKMQLCAASAPWCAAPAPRPRPDTPIAPSFAIGPNCRQRGSVRLCRSG
jgi:hypothetical protein